MEDASPLQAFHNAAHMKPLVRQIQELECARPITLMEVCGTHTHELFHIGIRDILPPNVTLISGPGCPVCVTPNDYLDLAIAYTEHDDIILATFGDLMRVPASRSSLEQAKAYGGSIHVVYSPQNAVNLARQHPDKHVCFLSVGFETTIPTIGAAILQAEAEGISNFSILPAMKVVPPALKALVQDPEVQVDGFILPGHVSVIIGEQPYYFLAETYGIPGVITGFEPVDLLTGLVELLQLIQSNRAAIQNAYKRVVRPEGNPDAQRIMQHVFKPTEAAWRGIGIIPQSGITVAESYERYNLAQVRPLSIPPASEPAGCRCGDILKGKCIPPDCGLFRKTCTPDHPVGACMVSMEGTCSAYYKSGAGL